MNTYQKNEQKVREMINVHKELYFNIEATDDNFEDKINESFNSLKNIQDFINKRLKIKTKPLLARVYISNRNKIREENDQYRKEISYRTQCLKEENTIEIQGDDSGYLIFNKTPYQHFKYIGVTKGIYKIKIITEHPIGIIYDNEEYPNKEFNYETVEKNLIVTGDNPYGEPKVIREDKWIMAPGDEIDNEDSEGLLNIGPHDFTIQFYTGEIQLEVLGDFGTVSYYCYNHGYMGGQKRLKYSDICLRPQNY